MQGSRVAIVGGGPGGLMTAHAIERDARSPFEITIYEASGRLGGKVLTRQFDRLAHDAVGPRDFYRGGLEAMPRDPRRFSSLLVEIGHPAARRHVEQLIHGDLATEPDRRPPTCRRSTPTSPPASPRSSTA